MAHDDIYFKHLAEKYSLAAPSKKLVFVDAAYGFASAPLIRRIVNDCLADDDEGLRIVVRAQDYEATKLALPALGSDSRLGLVIYGTEEYYRHFFTAGIIYTDCLLPQFFSKLDGQTVIGIHQADYFCAKRYSKGLLSRMLPTFASLDSRIDTSPNVLLDSIEKAPSRYVLVAMLEESAELYDNHLGNLKQFDSCFRGAFCAIGLELRYVVPSAIWRACLERRDNLPIERMVPDAVNVLDCLKASKVCLTDSKLVESFSSAADIQCIYQTACSRGTGGHNTKIARSWNEALREFSLCSDSGSNAVDSRTDCIANGNQFFDGGINPFENSKGRRRVLLVCGWKSLGQYSVSLHYLRRNAEKDNVQVDVLLTSSAGALLKQLDCIPQDLAVTYRSGYFISSAEEREAILSGSALEDQSNAYEDVARREWRRLIGDTHYDMVLGIRTDDKFWKLMYRYPPSDTLEEASTCQMLNKYGSFLAPYANAARGVGSYRMEEIFVKGEAYYYLGSKKGRHYYFPVCFEQGKHYIGICDDRSIDLCLAVWDSVKEGGLTLVLIHAGARSIVDDSSVLVTGLPTLSVGLLRSSLGVIAPDGAQDSILAACFGIPVFSFCADEESDKSREEVSMVASNDYWNDLLIDEPSRLVLGL